MKEDNTISSTAVTRPLLFISHRHADQAIAEVLRKFVTDRSGGRIEVYQSSSAYADGPQVGRELHRQLKERLWAAGVVVLVYTSPDEDWSTCMWECGVASHPRAPETKIVVLQCGPRSPSVYGESVRVNVQDPVDIQKFTKEFLTSPDFFPGHGEAVTQFDRNEDQVRQAARELHDALTEILPTDAEEGGEDWPTVPFLRLQLTYTEVDAIRKLSNAEGSRSVQEAARVIDSDGEALRIFGLGRLKPLEPFSQFVESWQQGRPDEPTKWVEELCEQIRVAGHWRRPRFGWELMRSVDHADRMKYSPVLSRVRSLPRQRCHQFDIYFSTMEQEQRELLLSKPSPPVEVERKNGGADEVTCSVFSPRLAAPGDEVLIQAYAHLPGQEEKVAAMVEHADLAASLRGSQPLAEPVARGAKLGFHLRMRDVEVDETDIVLVWRGEPLAAQFGVFFPEDFQPRSVNATVQVTKDGVPIGHVKFTLQVVTGAEKQRADTATAREVLGTLSRYGEAFVSYASQDRPEVLPMVQALSAARIKVFHDILELDPGERWAQELYKHIDTCDAFFLFWSKAAKASEWVLREALYARDRQGGKNDTPPEIIPIIIEGPPPVKPPPELNFLHFNDKFIYLRKGVEAEARAGTTRGRSEKQKLRERAHTRRDKEIERIEAMEKATPKTKADLKKAAENE